MKTNYKNIISDFNTQKEIFNDRNLDINQFKQNCTEKEF